MRSRQTILPTPGSLEDLPLHFPRTLLALRACSLADRCRVASSALDMAAGDASSVEPGTLRRRVDGIVRALVTELSGRVPT